MRDGMAQPRKQIMDFAVLMERELQANAHKEEHPLSHVFDHLISELWGHVAKLEGDPTPEHAADVANLAMLALAEIAPAESGYRPVRLPGAASGAAGQEQAVAALYVETGGVYFGLDGVDPWDEQRDARGYSGPLPVIAHPPCRSWSIMGQCRPEIVRGEDGGDEGCFAAALKAVQTFGGVLEHPARSRAWKHFGLPKPGPNGWYGKLFDGGEGWACEVDQRWYGHEARKPTWLYYFGAGIPPELRWGRGPVSDKTIGRSYGQGRSHLRARTPIAFRDLLIDLARNSNVRAEAAA